MSMMVNAMRTVEKMVELGSAHSGRLILFKWAASGSTTTALVLNLRRSWHYSGAKYPHRLASTTKATFIITRTSVTISRVPVGIAW